MNTFEVTFESSGFVSSNDVVGSEISTLAALGFTEVAAKEGLFPAGVKSLVRGYVTDDDGGAEDGQTKVFVSVTLLVDAENETLADEFVPPEALLTRITDSLLGVEGESSISLDDHAWEVVEVVLSEEPGRDPSDEVISNFKERMAAFQVENAVLISVLEKEADGNSLDDLYWDAVSDLKGELGSEAANNASDDSGAQENAISSVEAWVSNNSPTTIPLILWIKGVETGAAEIREELAA